MQTQVVMESHTNNILYTNEPLDRLPLGQLRRVDKPTNIITNAVQRIDLRDTAYGLAARGEYGAAVQKGVQQSLPGKYPLSAAQKDLIDHIALIQSNATAEKIAPIPQAPAVLTRHIKSVGYFLKADVMGVCKVPQSAYYSHDKQGNPIDCRYENAIIIVMQKEWNAMRASKGYDWMGDPLSFQAYAHLGLVAETIADYIRRLGWDASAQYGPSFVNRYIVLLPPLLIAAGIGEVSRAGIILNPFLGLAFKAAAVLTDMPIIADKPIDFGLQNFCQRCKICAENCPSKAISMGDKVMYNGYETWKLNTQSCASFNFTNKRGTMCNRCVKSCPWSNPTTLPHNLVRALVTRSRWTHPIAIRAAHSLKPGNDHPEDKWWFDLEYVGDEIKNRAQEEKSMIDTFTLADAAMKLILDRRSIRDYTPEPVSEEDLAKILEAGRQAPSGEDAQPWRFIIVKDAEARKKLGAIAGGGSGRRFTSEFVTQKMQERFANLQDEAKKKAAFEKLTSGQVSAFLAEAPVNIVVCGKKHVWDMPFDTSAAIENMLLMVAGLGLGACWVIAPCIDIRDEERVKELFNIPEGFKAVSIISVGHPLRPHRPRPRLPIHELVFNEKFGEPYYKKSGEAPV